MNTNLESVVTSNEYKHKKKMAIGAMIPALLALGSIGLGIYLASIDGAWWVMFFFVPIAAIMAVFAFIFFPFKQKQIYTYGLNENGLFQTWKNTASGEITEKIIPFTDMDKILIGMFPERIIVHKGKDYYRFEALLIMMYKGEYFFQRFHAPNDLQEWVRRLEDNVPIHYTDYDLSDAFHSLPYTKVDFSEVIAGTIDVVSEHVGKDGYRNRFEKWIPEGMEEQVKLHKKIENLPLTRKAEKRTLWILAIYSFIFIPIVFPGTPLDQSGELELTETLIFGYCGINLLIPLLLVFFRSHTRWYNPMLYSALVMLVGFIGVFITSIFVDIPSGYNTVFALNVLNFILWAGALIIAQAFKLVANFLYKHNLT